MWLVAVVINRAVSHQIDQLVFVVHGIGSICDRGLFKYECK